MGKKKFIDKKKAATFRLVYKDSSADDYGDGSNRVFTRVDGGETPVPGCFFEGSIFDDAEEEEEEEKEENAEEVGTSRRSQQQKLLLNNGNGSINTRSNREGMIPESRRRELVEMGFPDDGYNYLQHLREVGPSGLTGSFVPNNNLRLDLLRPDVKAYDASRVHVLGMEENNDNNTLAVSESTSRIRSTKGLDPDVAVLLEVDNDSAFASADELEDDFIARANEGAIAFATERNTVDQNLLCLDDASESSAGVDGRYEQVEEDEDTERPVRYLDEQFELLAMREYDDDEIGELDHDDLSVRGPAHISDFNTVMSDFLINSSLAQDKYLTPAEIEHMNDQQRAGRQLKGDEEEVASLSIPCSKAEDTFLPTKNTLMTDCVSSQSGSSEEEKEFIDTGDTDEEKDQWDCESIVTTYSNFDNHPGKIVCNPSGFDTTRSGPQASALSKSMIRLQGKQQLPVDYLRERRQPLPTPEKSARFEKDLISMQGKKPTSARKPVESKEERKARKAAVKEDKRSARAAKKELKLLYKSESQRAQHGAAFNGPVSIHLS